MTRKTRRPAEQRPLDARDRKLIEALRKNAWLSFGELGRIVNLSASATQRRVEKLIAAGVVLGAQARIADEKLGRGTRIFLLVELRDESTATINGFARKLSAHDHIVSAHYTAGAYDVFVALQVENMAQYGAFAAQVLNDNPQVRRYKTLTELRRL